MNVIQSVIRSCLQTLAGEIGPRPAASVGQSKAREFIADVCAAAGLTVEIQSVNCPRWELTGLSLRVDGEALQALANPHSRACRLAGPLVRVDSLEALEEASLAGRIVVLAGELTAPTGDIAAMPFFPKNFDFFRDERQDGIIAAVERQAPLAVITVSTLAQPVPLIVDSEFALPSVTVSPAVAAGLTTGRMAELSIIAGSQPGSADTVIARGPAAERRVVVSAHYDTAFYTPGAVDNAGGVAAMLALAKRLQAGDGLTGMEFVAFGGEDSWYPLDADYARRNAAYLPAIAAVINIDGIGIRGYGDAVSCLGCPEPLSQAVADVALRRPGMAVMEPWYAGDHSLFWRSGIPAIALTSAGATGYTALHTESDTLDRLDEARLAATVDFAADVIRLIRCG